jgi:hypothetical protein
MVRDGRAGIAALGRLAVSLPLQIEPREFLQIGITHALQLDFKALLQLPNAGLVSIACGRCGARGVVAANLPSNSQARRRTETPRGLGFCRG